MYLHFQIVLALISTVVAVSSKDAAWNVQCTEVFYPYVRTLDPYNPSLDFAWITTNSSATGDPFAILEKDAFGATTRIACLNGSTETGEGMLLFNAEDHTLNDHENSAEILRFGLVVDTVNETYQPMMVEEGHGSQGFYLDSLSTEYRLALGYKGFSDTIYACDTEVAGSRVIQLFHKCP